jgi:transcription-repair coupling factor (superfamily II helicase)
VDAYVPSTYVGMEAAKMDVHRRIALAGSEDDLRELESELADRFGPIPDPVANLIGIQAVRIALAPLGPVALSVRRDRIALTGVTLGAEDVRGLRSAIPGLLYQAAKHELSLRVPESRTAMEAAANLVAGIFEVRGRASLRPA